MFWKCLALVFLVVAIGTPASARRFYQRIPVKQRITKLKRNAVKKAIAARRLFRPRIKSRLRLRSMRKASLTIAARPILTPKTTLNATPTGKRGYTPASFRQEVLLRLKNYGPGAARAFLIKAQAAGVPLSKGALRFMRGGKNMDWATP